MSLPKYFSDFGKTVKDLLKPKSGDYDLKRPTVEVKLSHNDPKVNLTAKMESDNGKVNFELKDKIVCGDYGTLTVKLPTKKDLSLEFENRNGLADNLDLITKLQWNDSVKLTAKWRNSTIAAALDIEQTHLADGNGDTTVTPSFVVGPFVDSRLSVGARAVVKPLAQQETLTEYDVGVEYATRALTATAKVTDKATKLTTSLAYQVTPSKLFGVEYSFNPNSRAQAMIVGGKYNFTPTTSLQAKFANTGQVNAIFTQEVNSEVKIALSSRFDARNLEKDTHELGVKLVLGEI